MRPPTSDAPSIGVAPSGMTVFHARCSGVPTGVATIFLLGVSLSTCRYNRPFATPNGK